jgi:hypothetical protein
MAPCTNRIPVNVPAGHASAVHSSLSASTWQAIELLLAPEVTCRDNRDISDYSRFAIYPFDFSYADNKRIRQTKTRMSRILFAPNCFFNFRKMSIFENLL